MSREHDQVMGRAFIQAKKTASSPVLPDEKVARGPLIGGVLAAIGASLCCIGPLVLVSLGIGGAWVANLTMLEPYRPLFLGAALVAMVLAYRRIYRPKAAEVCVPGSVCAAPRTNRLYKILFWAVAALILAAGLSPYLAPLFY